MTITRHRIDARMDLPHYEYAATLYQSSFQGPWPNGRPDEGMPGFAGWRVTAPATMARGYNDRLSVTDVRVTYTAAGGSFWGTVLDVPTNRQYRMVAVIRNVGATTVAPMIYTGPGWLYPPAPLAPGESRTFTADYFLPFTGASTTNPVIFIDVVDPVTATPAAAVLAIASVTWQALDLAPYLDLRPEQAVAGLDESWSPYVQATLVCPLPDPSALAALDPRKGQRVQVAMTQVSGDIAQVKDMTALANDTATTRRTNGFRNGRPRTAADLSMTDNAWTHLAGTSETGDVSVLVGDGTTYPNNVDGGARWVVATAATGGTSGWRVAGRAGVNSVADVQYSLYARASVATTATLRAKTNFQNGTLVSDITSAPVTLPAGNWTRLTVIGRPGSASVFEATVALGSYLPVGAVLDVTQVMVEGVTAGTSPPVGEYFDGWVGRLDTTPGIPVIGPPTSSITLPWKQALRRYVAPLTTATVADLTEMFKYGSPAYTVAYLSDVFMDQYNRTVDPALNVTRTLDLGLRERAVDYLAATMTLTLTSDEMLAQDFGRVSVTEPLLIPPASGDLRALVAWGLNLIGGSLDPSSATAVINSADVDWAQGQSLWEFLDGFVSGADLRLRCDEHRAWFLEPPMSGATGAVSIGALTALDDVLSREEWADSVVLANHWTDPLSGNETTTYAAQASKFTLLGYTRTMLVTKQSKALASSSAAAALLKRTVTRGRRVAFSAVSNYAVTPGMTAYVRTPTTTIDPVMVSAVSWSFPEDEMTVTTRDKPL